MVDRSLDVWLQDQRIGRLDQEGGRLVFTYDAAWLTQPAAIPLSASLPLQAQPFDDRAARPFFAGLLPEQEKRDLVARALGVSARNDFGLLDRIGGECAGAVTFTHPGESPVQHPSAADYRTLNDEELAEILDQLPERPLLAGEKGIRLSLAGAQDKLPVLLIDGRVALPLHGVPSSHVLKPPIRRIEDSVYNEGFCLSLAKSIGLDAVAADIREVVGRPYLLVARYDRVVGPDGRPHRMHQEDLCQALGIAPELKYQNEGGPSLENCFALVRKAATPPAVYVPRLLDAAIFNVLVANHDAHGKNYSLIYDTVGTRLAPLYDVVCSAVYSELTPRMAMKIGGNYEFEDVYPRHWERFAKDSGLAAPQVRRKILELTDKLPRAAEALSKEFNARGLSRPVIERIVRIIQQRCSLTRKRFSEAKLAQ